MQRKVDQMEASVLRVGDRESGHLRQIQKFELQSGYKNEEWILDFLL